MVANTYLTRKNPWKVNSIQAFTFLKCPECNFDTKEEDNFQCHAIENHPLSFVFFGKTYEGEEYEEFDENWTVTDDLPNESENWEESDYYENLDVENNSDNLLFESPDSPDEISIKEEPNISEEVKPLECTIEPCVISFSGKNDIKDKTENFHEQSKPKNEKGIDSNTCSVCGKHFSFVKSLKRHILTVHEKIKPFKCEVESCLSTFVDRSSQNKHMKNVHEMVKPVKEAEKEPNKSIECPVCGKCLKGKSKDLRKHISSVHEKIKPFSCPIESCESTFRDKTSQKFHIENVHERVKPVKVKTEEPKSGNTCEICGKTFKGSIKDLKKHIRFVHEKIKPFNCPIESCTQTFRDKTRQRLHMESVHEGIKPYQCTECGVKFSLKSGLNIHMQSVHEEKRPYKCPLCDTCFKVNAQVKVHVDRVHKQLRPHLCTICGKGFSVNRQLKKHIETVHEGKKPHACPNCDLRFACKGAMKCHILAVHEKAKPYICMFCNHNFSRKYHLKTHIAKAHVGKESKVPISVGHTISESNTDTNIQPLLLFYFPDMMTDNPWQVNSINAFSFLKCPECSFDTKEELIFQDHALGNHPLSFVLFGKTCKEDEEILVDPVFIDIKQELPYTNESNYSESVEISDAEEKSHFDEVHVGKEFVDSIVKQEETINETTSNEQEKSNLKCSSCGYRSETRYRMKKHIAQQHKGQNVKFINMASKWHETRTSIEKSCKRNTVDLGNSSTVFQMFKCSQCDKNPFYTEQKLKEHVEIVHEGKKIPYNFNNRIDACAECGENFSSKSRLNLHMISVHVHKCPLCDRYFKDKDQLKVHVEIVHEGKKPYAYACLICDLRFSTQHSMTSHINAVHEKVKTANCVFCNKRFSNKRQLKNHIGKVHEDPTAQVLRALPKEGPTAQLLKKLQK